jgi:hypothetical protein
MDEANWNKELNNEFVGRCVKRTGTKGGEIGQVLHFLPSKKIFLVFWTETKHFKLMGIPKPSLCFEYMPPAFVIAENKKKRDRKKDNETTQKTPKKDKKSGNIFSFVFSIN